MNLGQMKSNARLTSGLIGHDEVVQEGLPGDNGTLIHEAYSIHITRGLVVNAMCRHGPRTQPHTLSEPGRCRASAEKKRINNVSRVRYSKRYIPQRPPGQGSDR